jgi:hypothetical protein
MWSVPYYYKFQGAQIRADGYTAQRPAILAPNRRNRKQRHPCIGRGVGRNKSALTIPQTILAARLREEILALTSRPLAMPPAEVPENRCVNCLRSSSTLVRRRVPLEGDKLSGITNGAACT